MLTPNQLHQLVNQHIYLFQDPIQATTQPNILHPHSHHPLHKPPEKPQLKIDIWKVNHTINRHSQNYIGPILSFQRRQIWTKNQQNPQSHPTPLRSQSIPNQTPCYPQPHSDLSQTLLKPSSHHKNTPSGSQHPSSHQNTNPCHQSLFSTVKPYPFPQVYLKLNQGNLPHLIPNTINIQSQQGNRHRISLYEQDQSKRNNFFARESVQSSQINRSQTKRKHKIFSLSSKPSKEKTNQKFRQTNPLVAFPQHSGYSGNLIKQQMSIDQKVSIFQEQSKPQSPQTIKQKNQIGQRLNQHHSLHVQCKEVRNTKQNLKEGHVKFDMGVKKSKDYRLDLENEEQEVQKMSIIDHLVTIPEMKEKAKLMRSGQIKSIVESDYVPSPEELSTILKTIEKQSRDARKVRSTIQKRKSVYQRKINNSIRYHEQNFDQYQQSNEPTEMVKGRSNEYGQFVPVHPKVFDPSLVSENSVRVKFSYLDVQSQKCNF